MKKKMLVLIMVSLAASAALAHKVKCFAAADGAKVAGYAWMSGGVRPKGVPFKVFDPDGKILFEGKTNDKGEFSFVPPKKRDLTIVVYAGPGHEGKFTIPADELPDIDAPAATAETADSGKAGTGKPTAVRLEATVSSQIAPLRAELAEFEDRETFRDVFAGLGYIAGIAGAAFFFFGTKQKEKQKE